MPQQTLLPISLQADAILEMRKRRREGRTKESFKAPFQPYGGWIAEARPEFRWDYRHFKIMQEHLDRCTLGELTRVIFQVAIRHGKTEHNTIGYIAYLIEKNPATRVLLISYNEKIALKFSRSIRRLVKTRGVHVSSERDSAGEWETPQGGGLRAVGFGTGIASINADYIIIDDPIGSRKDAESPASRDTLWDAFTDDVLARTEPDTRVLLTCSRWHIDDILGRALDRHDDRWTLVDLQGVAEYSDDDEYLDIMGREEGELLWPELRGKEWMDAKRIEMGSYGFASQIQLRPRPREGGLFQWEWWQIIKEVPAVGPMVRYWDLAGTKPRKGTDPDYSAGALLCRMIDERTAVVDMERFRFSVAARDARVLEVCKEDLDKYRGRLTWWFETETGIQGKERTDSLIRKCQNLGMTVHSEHPTGSKLSRAEPWASKAEAGNACIVEADWNDLFRLEANDFTGDGGGHDDQIDASSGADAKLAIPMPVISFSSARV